MGADGAGEPPPLPRDETVGALLERVARDIPTRPCVRICEPCAAQEGGCVDRAFSFGEFARSVSSLCRFLRTVGVGSGTAVAVLSRNSYAYAELALALARMGAVCVPVNVGISADNFQHIATTARAEFCAVSADRIVDARELRRRLPNLRVLLLEDPAHLPGHACTACPSESVVALEPGETDLSFHVGCGLLEGSPSDEDCGVASPDSVCFVLHTSGTKRAPKLVPLTHRNILANREYSRRAWVGVLGDGWTDSPSPPYASLGWMPFFHVIGLAFELIGNLYNGGCYWFAPFVTRAARSAKRAPPPSARELLGAVAHTGVDVLYCVPWMLAQVREAAMAEQAVEGHSRALADLRRLRVLMSGGVRLRDDLGDFFFNAGIKLVEGLGMTDTAGALMLGDPRVGDWRALRPIPGLNAVFVSDDGSSASPSDADERDVTARELVLVDCACVLREYVDDREATAAAFPVPGRFHTRDLFERIGRGLYRYIGRKDDTFCHTNGEKTNPLPIEAHIERARVVRRAALYGDQRPFNVAIVEVTDDAASLPFADVRARVLEAVDAASALQPAHSRISHDAVIIVRGMHAEGSGGHVIPAKPIPVTPKGSVARSTVAAEFATEIASVYERADMRHSDDKAPLAAHASSRPPTSNADAVVGTDEFARVEAIRAAIADVVRPGALFSELSPTETFADMGLSSVRMVQCRAQIEGLVGLPRGTLPPTLLFDHATPADLLAHLCAVVGIAPHVATADTLPKHTRDSGTRIAVSIVGMSCRLPGAANPNALWELLCGGEDPLGPVPRGRWDMRELFHSDPDAPGKIYADAGGFLPNVDRFDAALFGIGGAEAREMDPQHRIALEVAWEALEDAGMCGEGLVGGAYGVGGVFFGVTNADYATRQLRAGRPLSAVGPYYGTGNAKCAIAGRIAYCLNLRGPAVVVDTACSSSAVALHLACRAIANGECDFAVAGGVNLMLSPDASLHCSRAHMLSPSGRCRSFDAGADGYVRSEGCGAVVLRRADHAERDGCDVVCVVAGSALMQDGRSSGLTAPHGPSQVACIRRALSVAGVSPSEVAYVEAHGTGTELGDAVEGSALADVFAGTSFRERPLVVGALKSVVGHTESAAGISAVIKAALCLHNAAVPPNRHYERANSAARLDTIPAMVPATHTVPLEGVVHAGVSSFGATGTNAHIVLSASPRLSRENGEKPLPHPRVSHVVALSASSKESLAETALRVASFVRMRDGSELARICHTINCGRRTSLRYRLAAVGGDAESLSSDLESQGRHVAKNSVTTAPATPTVVFLFAGQGTQRPAMGRGLYHSEPAFRAAFDACDGVVRRLAGFSATRLLYTEDHDTAHGAPPVDSALYAHVALFCVEYALASMWEAWGVRPSYVAGHSLGEYVAACVAGAMSLEDALFAVLRRGSLLDALPNKDGAMVAVFAPEADVEALLEPNGAVAVAAVNGPNCTVLSGPSSAVRAWVSTHAASKGWTCRALGSVANAFHSACVDPILDDLQSTMSKVTLLPPRVPVACGLTGRLSNAPSSGDPPLTGAVYWRRHARERVRFADCIGAIDRDAAGRSAGAIVFVEIGPDSTLLNLARRCLTPARAPACAFLPSLVRGQQGDHVTDSAVTDTLAELYRRGFPVAWEKVDASLNLTRVRGIPTYAFAPTRYWYDDADDPNANDVVPGECAATFEFASEGALRGVATGRFVAGRPYDASEHIVLGRAVVPAAGHVAMVWAVYAQIQGDGTAAMRLSGASFSRPMAVDAQQGTTAHVTLSPRPGGGHSVRSSRAGDRTPNVTADIDTVALSTAAAGASAVVDSARARLAIGSVLTRDGREFYSYAAGTGLELAGSFTLVRGTKAVVADGAEEAAAVCTLAFPTSLSSCLRHAQPGIVDSALQCAFFTFTDDEKAHLYLPVSADAFDVFPQAQAPDASRLLECHVVRRALAGPDIVVDVVVSAEGTHVFACHAVRFRRVPREVFASYWDTPTRKGSALRSPQPELYSVTWETSAVTRPDGPSTSRAVPWVVVADAHCAVATVDAVCGALGTDPAGACVVRWLNDTSRDDLRAAIAIASAGARVVAVACVLESGVDALTDGVWTALSVGAVLGDMGRPAATFCVVRGSDDTRHVTSAAVASALRSASREFPALRFAVVDTGDDPDIAAITRAERCIQSGVLGHAPFESEIRYVNGKRLVKRIIPLTRSNVDGAAVTAACQGTCVITGGFGSLGLAALEWVVAAGCRTVALVGRGGATTKSTSAVEAIARCAAVGARIVELAADVADGACVGALQSALALAGAPPVSLVLHLAGVRRDGTVTSYTREALEHTFGGKFFGAINMAKAFAASDSGAPTPLVVLFSSAASILGSPGQALYAAANGALDGLASSATDGVRHVSVNWGPWSGAGMYEDGLRGSGEPSRRALAAFAPLSPPQALRLLEGVVASVAKSPDRLLQFAALSADWPSYAAQLRMAGTVVPRELELLCVCDKADDDAHVNRSDRDADDTRTIVVRVVRDTLGLSTADALDHARALSTYGMDSLAALEIRNALSRATGLALEGTLLFDYPTIDDLCVRVDRDRKVAPRHVPSSAVARDVRTDVVEADDTGDVVIAGMACRLPGGITSPDALWAALCEGRDCVDMVPLDHFDAGALVESGDIATAACGHVGDVRGFDAEFFGIPSAEADTMDPQQRMLLEVTWEALEHAGIVPSALAGQRVGVFVGLSSQDYAGLQMKAGVDVAASYASGYAASVASGRLAYCLNLKGPTLTIDTACSSSLVAVHLAAEAIRRGDCDAAIAGGVNLILSHELTVAFSKSHMLSPGGRCRTFDASADGYVRAEGCGLVVLRRPSLSPSMFGDRTICRIAGSAINHDGRSNGLTAPNGPAQVDCIRRALASARTPPTHVGYVEAHGTGTSLGDAVELGALAEVFGGARDRRSAPLLLGAIKSNIGHAEAAAGVASLMKAALCVQRGLVPPSLHCAAPNPHVDLTRVPARVAASLEEWDAPPEARVAGVSSFGFSGTNCHVVLRGREASTLHPVPSTSPPVFVVSAASPEALRDQLLAHAAYLLKLAARPDADDAYRAACGAALLCRERLPCRVSVAAETARDAAEAMKNAAVPDPLAVGAVVAHNRECASVFVGHVRAGEAPALKASLGWELVSRAALQCGETVESDENVLPDEWRAACGTLASAVDGAFLRRTSRALSAAASLPKMARHSVTFVAEDSASALAALCAAGALSPVRALACAALHFGTASVREHVVEHARLSDALDSPLLSKVVLADGTFLLPGLCERTLGAIVNGITKSGSTEAPAGRVGDHVTRGWVCLSMGDGADGGVLRVPLDHVAPASLSAAVFALGAEAQSDRSHVTSRMLDSLPPLPTYPFQRKPHWFASSLPSPNRSFARPAEGRSSAVVAKVAVAAVHSVGDVEVIVASHVRRLLGLPDTRVIDTSRRLMELGVDSLVATDLRASLCAALGISLPAAVVYEHPTVVALSQAAFSAWHDAPRAVREGAKDSASNGGASNASALSLVSHAGIERHDYFPLTPMQRAYWVGASDGIPLGGVSCHIYLEFDIATGAPAEVTLARLERAWRALVRRHDMLRVRVGTDGKQRTLPADDVPVVPFPRRTVPSLSEVDWSTDAWRADLSHRRYDPSQWPPFDIRATLCGSGKALRLHASFSMIAVDLWSLAILFTEWRRLTEGAPVDSLGAPPSIAFRDYVLHVHERSRADDVGETHKDAPAAPYPPPHLPLLRALDDDRSHAMRFCHTEGRIDRTAWAAVSAAAATSGVTKAMALLGVYAEVLARWSENKAFAVTATVFSRPDTLHADLRRVVGDFTTAVQVPVDIVPRTGPDAGCPQPRAFESVARDIQRDFVTLHAAASQRPFGGRRSSRDSAALALHPYVFTAFFPPPRMEYDMPDEWLGPLVHRSSETPQVVLDCQVHETRAGDLVISWDYVGELFPAGVVDDMLTSFLASVHSLAVAPAWCAPLDVLPSRHADVIRRVNAEACAFNPLANRLANPVCAPYVGLVSAACASAPRLRVLLHDPFVERAVETPDALAVVCASSGRRLTYREVTAAAVACAESLNAACGQFGSSVQPVAVFMRKGWQQIAGVLGVLLGGRAYVPIDPDTPVARVRAIVAACAPETHRLAVVTQSDVANECTEALAAFGGPSTVLGDAMTSGADDVWDRLAATEAAGCARRRGGDLAYVIFTSGSTGTPKGVEIAHASALNTLLDVNACHGVTARDRVLALSALSFDLSVYDIFGVLGAGGAVVVPSASSRRDPDEWAHLCVAEGVTLWNTVPAYLSMLVEHIRGAAVGGIPPHAVPALRVAMLSGDFVAASLVNAARGVFGSSLRVVTMGGATEVSVWSVANVLPSGECHEPLPYGRPMSQQTVAVLDEALRPCPLHVKGELYIGGVGVGMGYAGDVQRTRERFVDGAAGPGRWYRTGDVCSLCGDAVLAIHGRADHQVKIGGFRIETGEVEHAFATHPLVQRVVVKAIRGRGGSSAAFLAAFCVCALEHSTSLFPAHLRAHVTQSLPSHMVPSVILVLHQLPLSANGKIDHAALEALATAEPSAPSQPPPSVLPVAITPSHTRTLGAFERRVLAMCAEKLGVAADDTRLLSMSEQTLFECGGDSVTAVRLAAALSAMVGVRVPLRIVLTSESLGAMADAVHSLAPSPSPSIENKARTDAAKAPAPDTDGFFPDGSYLLTPGQRAYFDAERRGDRGARGGMPFCLRVAGKPDALALQRALGRLVARHEALRTVFPPSSDPGAPRATVLPPNAAHPRLVVVKCRGDDDVMAAVRTEARVPLALWPAPPVRVSLVRSRSAAVVVFNVHHIVCDGWSVRHVLYPDLARMYAEETCAALTLTADVPATPFSAFATRQNALVNDTNARERLLAFWKREVGSGLQLIGLPRESVLAAPPTADALYDFHVEVDAELYYVVLAAAATNVDISSVRGSPIPALLVAYVAALCSARSRVSEALPDFAIGVVGAIDRAAADNAGIVGYLTNVLAVRCTAEDRAVSWRSLVRQAAARWSRAIEHAEMPFETLAAAIAPGLALDDPDHPLVQASLAVVDETLPVPGEECAWRLGRPEHLGSDSCFPVALTVCMGTEGSRARVTCHWQADLRHVAREAVQQLASAFEAALRAMGERPDAPVFCATCDS